MKTIMAYNLLNIAGKLKHQALIFKHVPSTCLGLFPGLDTEEGILNFINSMAEKKQ